MLTKAKALARAGRFKGADALFIAAAVVMALNRHDEALEAIEQALRE